MPAGWRQSSVVSSTTSPELPTVVTTKPLCPHTWIYWYFVVNPRRRHVHRNLLYIRFRKTCLLWGFTFTFIVTIIILVFVPGRSRVVQKLKSGFVPDTSVVEMKIHYSWQVRSRTTVAQVRWQTKHVSYVSWSLTSRHITTTHHNKYTCCDDSVYYFSNLLSHVCLQCSVILSLKSVLFDSGPSRSCSCTVLLRHVNIPDPSMSGSTQRGETDLVRILSSASSALTPIWSWNIVWSSMRLRPVSSPGTLRWWLKILFQTTRTVPPTVSPSPSPSLNPRRTLTKLLRNLV